jgi:hypothetical protein
MASLILLSAVSLSAFADDSADREKLNAAADQSAACANAKDMQQVFIYYQGDDAALRAQVEAYAQDDTRLQNRVLTCVNDLGNVMVDTETSKTFAQKMRDRFINLMGSVSEMSNRAKEKMGRGQNMKIDGPVSILGIRG